MPSILSDHVAARILKALADPVRLGIVRLLARREHAVGEMAEVLGLTVARVSHHLAILRSEDLVADQRRGKQVFYTLVTGEAGAWRRWADASPEVCAVLASMGSGQPAKAVDPLSVFAASDLSLAFTSMGLAFEATTGITVRFRFGATHTLGRELAQHANADLFAAASELALAPLVADDLIDPQAMSSFARGRLALWSRAGHPAPPRRLRDLIQREIRWVVIPNPEHAPNGVAAVEALRREGIWEEVRAKLLLGNDAQQALQFADTDNDAVAIIPQALAAGRAGRHVAIPANRHRPLEHLLVPLQRSRQPVQARAFASFVTSESGRDILRQFGFAVS